MMKKIFAFFFPALAGTAAALLLSCAGAPAGQGTLAPAQGPRIQTNSVIVDYQGAAVGAPIPEWVTLATTGDTGAFSGQERFEGKAPFVFSNQGQNLDMLRSWVNNFSAQGEVSRRIETHVDARFGAGQIGEGKDSPENQQYIRDVAANASNTTFSGLAKEMDYWIKNRNTETGTETYSYYVVYSMPEENLQAFIDEVMGKTPARTQEQEELKRDIAASMKRATFDSAQQTNN